MDFKKYCKRNHLDIYSEKSLKMYNMYISGELEVEKKCMKDLMGNSQFVSKQLTPVEAFNIPQPPVKQEVENTMSENTNTERSYLTRRMDAALYEKNRKLATQFHIGERTGPKTYRELIDWIKKGNYELDEKRTKKIDAYVDNNEWYGDFLDGIIWTGRGFIEDYENYSLASQDAKKMYQDALDIIMTSDATEGLKALKEFQNWTYKSKK